MVLASCFQKLRKFKYDGLERNSLRACFLSSTDSKHSFHHGEGGEERFFVVFLFLLLFIRKNRKDTISKRRSEIFVFLNGRGMLRINLRGKMRELRV